MSNAHSGSQAFNIGTATRLYNMALSLPSSVGMTEAELQHVISAINDTKLPA